MPLPESRRLPPKFTSPFLGTWQRLVAVLTGSSAVAAFTLWSVYAVIGSAVTTPIKVSIVLLVLAVAVVAALIDQLRQYSRRYQAAVAPIYDNHPSTDQGIDVLSIYPYSNPPLRGREFTIQVEARAGKLLLFTCVGNIDSIMAALESRPKDSGGSVSENVLTPNMFELDLDGRAGELSLLLESEDYVRIAAIEWRDAHEQSN